MSTPLTVDKLPLDIRIELKRRLREGVYDILSLTEWLKEAGHTISKSAVGRYSLKLKLSDVKLGLDRELMAKQGADIAALFEELAILKTREIEIISQLKTATLFHKPSVQPPKK